MKWTNAAIVEAQLLRQDGLTWNEIGKQFDVSGDTVRKTLANQKVLPPVKIEPWQPEEVDWREWMASWEKTKELHQKIAPELEKLTLELGDEPIAIAFAADLHLGGHATEHEVLRETIELILATEGLYLGIVGDSIEGFIPGLSPNEAVSNQPASLQAQLSALRNMVSELVSAQKLKFITWGDHDAKWLEKATGFNVVKFLLQNQVPYFNGRGLIKLNLSNESYWIVVNHRERFASQWNRTHPSRRQYERFFPADLNVTAHIHKPAFAMDYHYEQLREQGLPIGGKHYMIVTGTFKTGYDAYSVRGWDKGVLGVPTVVLYPDRHDLDIFDSPAKAALWLKALKSSD